MNAIEREAIILNSAWVMIDDMVNWAIFEPTELGNNTHLLFKERTHSKLFAILLTDFLSPATQRGASPLGLAVAPKGSSPSDQSFLFQLKQVCAQPTLGTDTSELSESVRNFALWLDQSFVARGVNFSSIDIVADLQVTRHQYLKMCGDIAKHSIPRLSQNVSYLKDLLRSAGHDVCDHHSYLAIDDFAAWFHDDIFVSHSGYIAELLNDIRLAIYAYLLPEYRRSWHLADNATELFPLYRYRIPKQLKDEVAKGMYWDVMNRCRAKPSMTSFQVPDFMKRLH